MQQQQQQQPARELHFCVSARGRETAFARRHRSPLPTGFMPDARVQ